MCDQCFNKGIAKFESESVFKEFEARIQSKIFDGSIEVFDPKDKEGDIHFDFNVYYKCKSCHETWILSIPDQAWRGYFLTYEKALEYQKRLEKENRRGCIVWIVIIGIFIFILWQLFK